MFLENRAPAKNEPTLSLKLGFQILEQIPTDLSY